MNMFQRVLLLSRKKAKADGNSSREQRVIKLDDSTYQIVWADEYDRWVSYLKDTGKLK
ncbi:MAG: hypothetical protein QXW10_00295 [Candidatus Micrarchaeaceae archaeon]